MNDARIEPHIYMADESTDTYIETYSGKKFNFLKPNPDDIDIIDIAHSLGMQCRYTGHAKTFYSIAEHSIVVSKLCCPEHAFWGLMHDATEAYLTDVASPVKRHLLNYKEIETNLMNAICLKYGLPEKMPEEVHNADMEALRSEARYLMTSRGEDWKINQNNDNPIIDVEFKNYTHNTAKVAFLSEFEDLWTRYNECK